MQLYEERRVRAHEPLWVKQRTILECDQANFLDKWPKVCDNRCTGMLTYTVRVSRPWPSMLKTTQIRTKRSSVSSTKSVLGLLSAQGGFRTLAPICRKSPKMAAIFSFPIQSPAVNITGGTANISLEGTAIVSTLHPLDHCSV